MGAEIMPQKQRRLSPYNILYVWEAIKATKQVPANGQKVLKCMTDLEYNPDDAEEVLSDALHDGVLLAVPATGGKSGNWKNKSLEGKAFKLPELEDLEVDNDSHDWYCYECHKPGELQNCSDCPRAFHLSCRRSIQKLNEDMNLSSKQRINKPPLNESTAGQANREPDQADPLDQSDLPEQDAENTPANNEIVIVLDDNIENVVSDQKPTLEDITEELEQSKIEMIPNLKNEADVKPAETKSDIIYIGEVRPPIKRRRAKSVYCYKSEIGETDEDDTSNLCTRCKLVKMSSIRDPPNMKASEVNYLLRFTFERIKTWISSDTFSPLSFSNSMHLPSKKEWEVLLKLAFKCPVTYKEIDDKITNEKYTTLTEFQCDVMDIQHCIAILYDTDSTEYDATNYLINDCSYDLAEIRRCRDCYRHSNEKSTPLWFCKPCVPRHELVFAKQTGYCFWPAKVIKVKDNQYDVRFFGAHHSRANVDARYVRPIDTDEALLKVKKSEGYKNAVEELRKHQEFLQLPPGTYSYEAERSRPNDIAILGTGISINPMQGISEINQRKSGTRTPKLSGGARKGTPKTPHTAVTARLSPLQTRNSPILTIEGHCSHDKSLGSGKRKRKAVRGNYGSGDDAESSSSDLPSGKKRRSKSFERLQKKKGKRGRKSIADKLYYAPPHALKKNVSPEQTLALTPTPSNDHISSQDAAVSSTQEISPQQQQKARPGRPKLRVSKAGKTYNAAVENLRRQLDTISDIAILKKTVLETFQTELDRRKKAIDHIMEEQNNIISQVKMMQWCHHCEREAIYYCCWNTAYCSTFCQQQHWQREHKKVCRRTR